MHSHSRPKAGAATMFRVICVTVFLRWPPCKVAVVATRPRELSDLRSLSNIAIAVDNRIELANLTLNCCIVVLLVGRPSLAIHGYIRTQIIHLSLRENKLSLIPKLYHDISSNAEEDHTRWEVYNLYGSTSSFGTCSCLTLLHPVSLQPSNGNQTVHLNQVVYYTNIRVVDAYIGIK